MKRKNFMYNKIRLIIPLVLVLGMCSPVVFAVDDVPYNSIYHDAKFDFKLDVSANKQEYKVTLTRKDNDFNNRQVLLIYNIIVRDANSPYPTTVTDYLALDPNMKTTSVTRHLSGSQTFRCIKEQSYGIKFPPFSEIQGETSLPDTVFGLCLKYRAPQLKWEKPCIDYFFYRRDNKPMNCKAILRRPIVIETTKGKMEKEWLSFTIDNGASSHKDIICERKDLKEFYTVFREPSTSQEEYYLQFTQ